MHLVHKHHRKISALSHFKLELACVDLIHENEMQPLNPIGTTYLLTKATGESSDYPESQI